MNVLEKSFIKDDDLVARNIGGETLIVPVKHRVGDLNAIYTLNDVGARVWQLIDGRIRVDQIVETISAEYDVAADQAAGDIVELVDSMESAGLIRPVVESEA